MQQSQTLEHHCREIIQMEVSSRIRAIELILHSLNQPIHDTNPIPQKQCRLPHPLDIGKRLEELGRFETGWMNGEGKALPQEGLQWLLNCFDQYFLDNMPLPYICPTEDGGVCLEWPLATMNFSLEIDFHSHSGYWHSLNYEDNSSIEKDIDLNLPESWRWFCGQIKQGGVL